MSPNEHHENGSLTGVELRPRTDADQPFLQRLYASTRAAEMTQVDWPEAEVRRFLEMQFLAQDVHYRKHFPDASFDVIEKDGERVGRLYLDVRDDEHRIIDIALLPEHRGQGLGGALMRRILNAAGAEGKLVRIHVEHNNPALRLYRRLGFRHIEEQGVYLLMEWSPA